MLHPEPRPLGPPPELAFKQQTKLLSHRWGLPLRLKGLWDLLSANMLTMISCLKNSWGCYRMLTRIHEVHHVREVLTVSMCGVGIWWPGFSWLEAAVQMAADG